MNKKKRVIFFVNSNLQYSAEFNENMKVKMLKSYFKDVSHFDKFSFITQKNNNVCDEQALKDICQGSREIFFRVIRPDEKGSTGDSQIEELLNENNKLRRENTELMEIIHNYQLEQGNL